MDDGGSDDRGLPGESRGGPIPDLIEVHSLGFAPYLGIADSFAPLLSSGELPKANRFRFEKDRQRYVLSHAFVRIVLGRCLGRPPREIVFETGPYGKPFVVPEPGSAGSPIGFSLSHCDTHAVVALGPTAVLGVDVERFRSTLDPLAIAGQFFAAEEAERLKSLSGLERERAFLRLWTCKEAFVKAVGLGFRHPLDRVLLADADPGGPAFSRMEPQYGPASEWTLFTAELADGCQLAVAARIPNASVEIRPGSLQRLDDGHGAGDPRGVFNPGGLDAV